MDEENVDGTEVVKPVTEGEEVNPGTEGGAPVEEVTPEA